MAALATVDELVRGRQSPSDVAGLSMYLLDRERLHWARLCAGRFPAQPGSRCWRISGFPVPGRFWVATLSAIRPRRPANTPRSHTGHRVSVRTRSKGIRHNRNDDEMAEIGTLS
jgi:hypothetical protein